jgi:hypothetical protein
MAAMMEDSQYLTYSAGHLSGSYDSPSQSPYMNAPIPYRACSALTAVPVYTTNLTYFAMPDQNQAMVDIHPDEMVGSNTEAPPEIAAFAHTTPHHILSQVQHMRFKSSSFSAPSAPQSPSYAYLPPGAFHTKPLMRRSSNIPASHSAVPTSKTEYEESQMMADQPSYVAVDGTGDYLQDMQFQYEQPIQHNMNTEMSETFLQPQSQPQPQTQGFVRPDAYSPPSSAMSNDYSSPSLPITPPPSGTFPQQSFYYYQQQMMSQYVTVGMPTAGPVPMSSPSMSEDGCCNPRSLFVDPSATMAETYITTPPTMSASPEQYEQIVVQPRTSLKMEDEDADAMEDVTPSDPQPKEDIPSPKPASPVKTPSPVKAPSTPKRPSKRLVATPPRRRQTSAMSRKSSVASAPALERRESQESASDGMTVRSVPARGRVPKRLKDALVALTPAGSTTPELVARSIEMSRSETQITQLSSKADSETAPEQSTAQTSRASSVKAETPSPSPKTTGRQTGSIRSKKRKARVSSAPVLPSDPAKVFICDVLGCEKRFRRSEHLKRHQRSLHTLEKPYVCNQPDCNKKFSRSDNLNQHLRVHKRNSTEGEGPPFVEDPVEEEVEEKEEAPPTPVKPKRRRGPRSVGAAASKRRNRNAPPPITQINFDDSAEEAENVEADDADDGSEYNGRD